MNLSTSRIVVTGGAGFLGRHLVESLRVAGAQHVMVPRSAEFDLVRSDDVARLYKGFKPDLVFHLAARVGGIGANQKNPGSYFHDNLLMGVNVIEQARRYRVPKTIMVGTICAYPKFAPIPFREETLWDGYPEETNAPYGVAKKSLIVMAEAYRQQYGLNVVCLLPVNLYGPHDNFDLETSHVIPAMIRKFIAARDENQAEVVLWGDGSPTREFLYVNDCVEALVLAADKYDSSEPINIGAGFEVSIRDLAEQIAGLTRFRGRVRWDASRPNGQPRRMLDVQRARRLLGFSATTALAEGLARTVEWYEVEVRNSEGAQ